MSFSCRVTVSCPKLPGLVLRGQLQGESGGRVWPWQDGSVVRVQTGWAVQVYWVEVNGLVLGGFNGCWAMKDWAGEIWYWTLGLGP